MKKLVIVIPAYNEEKILENNISKIYSFFTKQLKRYDWKIIISDNDSKDDTLKIAQNISKKLKRVSFVHMNKRPKSLSIKKVWLSEDADIYSYMDADLSTDIKHFPELIQSLGEGYDIAIGSRTKELRRNRSIKREVMSQTLIFILRNLFSIKLTDFQCGFKAINRKTKDNIIPKMKALKHGFMDTEMIIVATKKGYKIKSIPVNWQDLRESKIQTFQDVIDTSKNIFRIKLDLIFNKYR